jgi:hypothetical protein
MEGFLLAAEAAAWQAAGRQEFMTDERSDRTKGVSYAQKFKRIEDRREPWARPNTALYGLIGGFSLAVRRLWPSPDLIRGLTGLSPP